MTQRVSTKDRHEYQYISGKVWHLLLDQNGFPSCGYCNQQVLWTQVAESLQDYRRVN